MGSYTCVSHSQIIFDSIAASISMIAVPCAIWIGYGTCASYLQVRTTFKAKGRSVLLRLTANLLQVKWQALCLGRK